MIKNLVTTSLLALGLSHATGCIIESDSGFDLDVSWVCPANADGIVISTRNVDNGQANDDAFGCAEGNGIIVLDAGSWDVFATPEASGLSFASSDVEPVDAADGDLVLIDFSFPENDGFMALTWTIDDADPAPACGDLASAGVSLIATIAGTTTALEDLWNCGDGGGVTSPMPLDDYVAVFSLLNDVEESLADSEPRNVTLDYGDQLEDLGNFNFVTL